ncbi:hypothetical protein CHS0354_021476 [Potamilus streckersoni]|uniref:Uncharacterized protein n=1 Tax=Potamilus streckersoni TaxID=2493646 RepID=A0AAE0S1T1_9BIVA|nr:hypothetical protein CHS0354_021476 [Potamilus streckersoni]
MASTYNIRGVQRTPWMKLRAFLTIFGGLLVHLALGGQYTFGKLTYITVLIGVLSYSNTTSAIVSWRHKTGLSEDALLGVYLYKTTVKFRKLPAPFE